MGSRRIRDLKLLEQKVDSWDIKDEKPIPDLKGYDAVVISTPPDHHNEYIELAIEKEVPAFVEASVVLGNLEQLNDIATSKKVLVCPSCTFKFDKYVKSIKRIIREGTIGRVLNFNYQLGQSVEDWHKDLNGYYAVERLTGAAREMVTFDWTWLFDLFGTPESISGFYGKTEGWGYNLDDTYAMAFKYKDKFGTMLTDATSKEYIKRIVISAEKGVLIQDWAFSKISEDMYYYEMEAFLKAVGGKEKFPNTLDDDIKILKSLERLENEK